MKGVAKANSSAEKIAIQRGIGIFRSAPLEVSLLCIPPYFFVGLQNIPSNLVVFTEILGPFVKLLPLTGYSYKESRSQSRSLSIGNGR